MSRRNFIAMSLRSPKFSQKVVGNKKRYNKKKAKMADRRERQLDFMRAHEARQLSKWR